MFEISQTTKPSSTWRHIDCSQISRKIKTTETCYHGQIAFRSGNSMSILQAILIFIGLHTISNHPEIGNLIMLDYMYVKHIKFPKDSGNLIFKNCLNMIPCNYALELPLFEVFRTKMYIYSGRLCTLNIPLSHSIYVSKC